MHNISKVINFEVVRTLKKWTFWLAALSVPVFMALGMGISFYMQHSAEKIDATQADNVENILVKDDTGYFTPETATKLGVSLTDDSAAAEQAVKDGQSDLFIIYPSDPLQNHIKVFNQDTGVFNNGKYENTAKSLLVAAVNDSLSDPQAGAILLGSNSLQSEVTSYREGETTSPASMVVPLICLAVLFFSIMMCSNTILVATTEEKENRITEMILTTVKSRTLVIGKICAQWILMLIQMALLVLPIIAALVFFPEVLPFNLGDVSIDPGQLAIGAALALSGIALFTGLGFAIGSVVPTAKEANSFFGIIILLLMLPFIFLTGIMSDPNSTLVQFLTYFPLTSPMTILLRMAFETLPVWLPLVGIAVSAAAAALVLTAAARIFQYGNLTYSRRLSIKEIVSRRARA
jgi:ABC-2 type transport system permease protein